jgi:RecG-like helicase
MVFGTQQHGLTDLQFLSVVLRDLELLEAAREEARAWAESSEDGRTAAIEVLNSLRPAWKQRLELVRVG